MQTDASDLAVGAVLFQELDDGEHPISFASRTLTSVERKYSATERELIGVIFGIEHFRGYIEGTRFCVITDCAALKWLNNLREPTGRLARWSLRLSQFDFEIRHRPGKQNVVPDALSRAICQINVENFVLDEWYTNMLISVQERPDEFPNFRVENNLLYKFLPTPYPMESNISDWKLVIPTNNRREILEKYHNDVSGSHFGLSKTMHRITEFYYWPKLKQSVSEHVKSCKVCAAHKANNRCRPGLMGQEKKISFPFQLISMDLMGPLPRSVRGNKYLFVVTDWFSKFVFVQPLRTATSKPIIKFLAENVFSIFGVPQIVLCDNGPQFISREFKSFLNKYKVQKIWYSARYCPQINFTERINRVLKTVISSYIQENHREWDKYVFDIAQAIRSARHDVTEIPPSFLVFGRHVPISGDFYGPVTSDDNSFEIESRLFWAKELSNLPELYKNVSERLHKAYLNNSRQYNLRRRPLKFVRGDIVWKKNYVLSDASKDFASKLSPKYIPCRVVKVISPLVYHLEDLDGHSLGNWHVKDLKENNCEFPQD